MNTAISCFEIVRFAFKDEVTMPTQLEAMKRLGRWASIQPGYLSRQSYHDPQTNLWIDVVEWQSVELAHEAMEKSQLEPSLGDSMSLIDPDKLQVGHFQRQL